MWDGFFVGINTVKILEKNQFVSSAHGGRIIVIRVCFEWKFTGKSFSSKRRFFLSPYFGVKKYPINLCFSSSRYYWLTPLTITYDLHGKCSIAFQPCNQLKTILLHLQHCFISRLEHIFPNHTKKLFFDSTNPLYLNFPETHGAIPTLEVTFANSVEKNKFSSKNSVSRLQGLDQILSFLNFQMRISK